MYYVTFVFFDSYGFEIFRFCKNDFKSVVGIEKFRKRLENDNSDYHVRAEYVFSPVV